MSLHVVEEKNPKPIYAVEWRGVIADLSEIPDFNRLVCCINDVRGGMMKADFGLGEVTIPLHTFICYQENRGFFLLTPTTFKRDYKEVVMRVAEKANDES